MSTTLRDFGRNSEEHGEIAFYYAFPIKFWFGQHMIVPEDVHTWCRINCRGYYKVINYTHNTSKRTKYSRTNEFDEKVVFVDKIYLSDEADAAAIKLIFEVRSQQVKRPGKLKARRRKTKTMKSK